MDRFIKVVVGEVLIVIVVKWVDFMILIVKYFDVKICFIDLLMICCVFLVCKFYEINIFNFFEIIFVCSNDLFGNLNFKF